MVNFLGRSHADLALSVLRLGSLPAASAPEAVRSMMGAIVEVAGSPLGTVSVIHVGHLNSISVIKCGVLLMLHALAILVKVIVLVFSIVVAVVEVPLRLGRLLQIHASVVVICHIYLFMIFEN